MFLFSAPVFYPGESMAIGGIVITARPEDRKDTEIILARFPELTVYGSDEKGNIIARVEGGDSDSIGEVIRAIESIETVCEVNLAYLTKDDKVDDASGTG
jgi:nitrate reductase NapAB chaperone NapD